MQRGIVYYSNNIIDDTPLNKAVRIRLLEADLPIVSVTHKPINFGTNIVVDFPNSGRSLIEQLIIGLENSKADYLFACEHDCLYPKDHFDYTSDLISRNLNTYRLYSRNFAIVNGVLSAYSGPKIKFIQAMMVKLELYIRLSAKDEKVVMWYEPGIGDDMVGSKYKVNTYSSKTPMIDVRHSKTYTQNNTGTRRGQITLPYWGSYKDLRQCLSL